MAGRNHLLLQHRYFSQSAPSHTADIEFDESDVWGFQSEVNESKESPVRTIRKTERKKEIMSVSLPVNVPAWSRMEDNYYDDDLAETVVPPHEYLRRRMRGVVSFSVHEGIGRTLKGRDLSRVRNAVWGNVGFQD